MKRLSGQAFLIDSDELRHGWSVEGQLRRNPASRRLFPEWRDRRAVELLKRRSNQWARRAQKSSKPEDYERAAYVLRKAGKIVGRIP